MKRRKKLSYQKTIILGFGVLYILCMLFSTFLMKEKYETDYKEQAGNVLTQIRTICSDPDLILRDAEGNYNPDEMNKITLALSSIFSGLDKYNQMNAALYGPNGEILARTTEYFGENYLYYDDEETSKMDAIVVNSIYDYFSEEELNILFDYLEKAYKEDKKGDKLEYIYEYELTYHQQTGEPVCLELYRVHGERTTKTDVYEMVNIYWEPDGKREFLWEWENTHIENLSELRSDFSQVNCVTGNLTGLMSLPYFSEGRSVYEKWKNNTELQTFDVSKSRFDGTYYLPSSYVGTQGVSTVVSPVFGHQTTEKAEENNKWQYAIQLNQVVYPWHAAVAYMKYVYLYGLILMAACMLKTLHTTRKAYKKQEELEQTRRDFTNAIAHELKTPLSIIRNLAENMEREQSEEKNSYYRSETIRQTEIMDELVQEMIFISKMDSDKVKKVLVPVSVAEIVEEQLSKLEPQMKEMNIRTEFEKENDFIIHGDKSYLEKAIFNLLENAVSHNRKDGKISLWIDKNICRIENTADAIPDEDIPHIYDMFFTGNKSRNSEKKHNGLGLYLAKRIFDMYDVELEVKNTDIGVKTEFRVK